MKNFYTPPNLKLLKTSLNLRFKLLFSNTIDGICYFTCIDYRVINITCMKHVELNLK